MKKNIENLFEKVNAEDLIKQVETTEEIKIPKKEKSDQKISSYITKTQLDKFYKKAAEQNLNVSGMLRELVLDFIKD